MDIAILNYPTGKVDILRDVEIRFAYVFSDDVEDFLKYQGYKLEDIHYMCSEEIIINETN